MLDVLHLSDLYALLRGSQKPSTSSFRVPSTFSFVLNICGAFTNKLHTGSNMSIQRADRPGSINFDKKGGLCNYLCCNFNPVHYCCVEPQSSFYSPSESVLMYSEEPGPGWYMCLTLPSYCLCLTLFLPCSQLPLSFNYIYCGVCGPVNFNGITFYAVDGAVQGKVNVKHCCTEATPVILLDVQDIRAVETRKLDVNVPSNENSPGYTLHFTYYLFEILYRNEADQIMRFKTREVKNTTDLTPYITAVHQFIEKNRTKANGRVTFEIADQDIGAAVLPVQEYGALQNKPCTVPEPQQCMVREHTPSQQSITNKGYTSVHPYATAPLAVTTAVPVDSYAEYEMY